MSFFKDFKADFTQVMNELMPDGNEMYDEEETVGTGSELQKESDTFVKAEKKKKSRARKSGLKQETEDKSKPDKKASKQPRGNSARKKAKEKKETDLDIAPEDMLEQIDDMLDRELYSDQSDASLFLDDDMEVNTMDMSVEELLNQLTEKQQAIVKTGDSDLESGSLHANVQQMAGEKGLLQDNEQSSVDDLLSQLDGTIPQAETAIENIEEVARETYVKETDMGLETLLDSISTKSTSVGKVSKAKKKGKQGSTEESRKTEHFAEESEKSIETETIAKGLAETLGMEEDERIEYTGIQDRFWEPAQESGESVNIGAVSEELQELGNTENEQFMEDIEELEEKENKVEESLENESLEGNAMSAENDVISIDSVEEKTEESALTEKDEQIFKMNEADTETTYITKGTKIKGNLETDGSIDVIGNVEGNIDCKGKIVIGGQVTGDITAGELYANNAKVDGNIKSYGSVKVGVGTIIVGSIEAESAVIAGSVNGDIDVKGPVIVDSTAVIMGNIKSRSVQINNGAVIEGFCSQVYSDIDVKSFFA